MKDQHRKRAFATAAVALVASSLAVTRANQRTEDRDPPSRPTTPAAIQTEKAAVAANHARTAPDDATDKPRQPAREAPPAAATQAEREPQHVPAIAPRNARPVTAAARAFLAGYLSYSYGRADARRIRSAAGKLLRELRDSPPRVPATLNRDRPRVVSARVQAATGELEVRVLALVADGRRRYRIPLEVREVSGDWLVTAIGG